MKLKVLAVAVAASFAFPMAAQADGHGGGLKITGDIGVFYSGGDAGTDTLNEAGSEINLDASSEHDGITYYGHTEVDLNGTGAAANFEEVRVGAKGSFGEVVLGEVDNACDQFDPGPNSVWIDQGSASCGGSDVNNILYKNKMGGTAFAVSHNPNKDESALGVQAGMGPVTVNLGYEDLNGIDRVSYGVKGSFNGFNVNAEGNDNDQWGLNADFSMNGNTVWLGTNDNSDIGLGVRRAHGKMDYIFEYVAPDVGGDKYAVGLRYRF